MKVQKGRFQIAIRWNQTGLFQLTLKIISPNLTHQFIAIPGFSARRKAPCHENVHICDTCKVLQKNKAYKAMCAFLNLNNQKTDNFLKNATDTLSSIGEIA